MAETIAHKSIKIETKQDFEELFNSHYSNLCAYANNFLKDVDASEEVVQEVLFKLWTNRESIIITSSVHSYLFRAVRNASLNVLKHVNIREDYKIQHEYERDDELSSEDEMIVSELDQKIRAAIDQLPMERKKVFILSRYDGLKYKEIADKLNISVSTVENQMVKALKYLREELKDYLPWIILFFGNLFKNGG
ncbi:MAG: RNA polymerase sigma-70 factor [Bacteroidetes bacterium]|nr:RNA polymerase sigma-70 factor [Bacteroidota bacterium]